MSSESICPRPTDVILSLGARFEEMETNWRPAALPSPVARVIQVDIDAAEIGRSVPAQLGIIGDIRAVLEDLLAAIHARAPARRGSFGPMRASRNARPSSSARTSRSRRKRRAGNGRSIRCASSALCARRCRAWPRSRSTSAASPSTWWPHSRCSRCICRAR